MERKEATRREDTQTDNQVLRQTTMTSLENSIKIKEESRIHWRKNLEAAQKNMFKDLLQDSMSKDLYIISQQEILVYRLLQILCKYILFDSWF